MNRTENKFGNLTLEVSNHKKDIEKNSINIDENKQETLKHTQVLLAHGGRIRRICFSQGAPGGEVEARASAGQGDGLAHGSLARSFLLSQACGRQKKRFAVWSSVKKTFFLDLNCCYLYLDF